MASAVTKIPLRIGLFGGGVVGGGVYELVKKYTDSGCFAALGANVQIAKICVRSLDKPRDFTVDASTKFVTDYDSILNDDSINCVVELMGGTTHAKDVVFRAISAGKHVVTANKALIASYLPELQHLLAQNPSVHFAYEAAVCGGIPIIHTLQSCFAADTIHKVMGIMNGTTNYMLCRMEDEKVDYADVLAEAQRLGFAEADPTADVEGHDVQAKIALLAKLAFGVSVPVSTVPCTGISRLSSVDFDYASLLKSTIKLLGTASYNPVDHTLAVFVSPCLVPLSSPLAAAKGPGNTVLLHTQNLGTAVFAGPGAGRFPTANSVVSDLVRLAQQTSSSSASSSPGPFPLETTSLPLQNDYTARFYVRISCGDALGIIRQVGEAAETHGVSIHAILQNPIVNPQHLHFAVVTEEVRLSQVQAFAADIERRTFCLGAPVFMNIL